MRRTLALLTALTAGTALTLFSPVALTAAEAAPKIKRTIKADLDGDGRKDTVQLTMTSSKKITVTVTTNPKKKKKRVKASITLSSSLPATKFNYAAVALDGKKGSELVIGRYFSEDQVFDMYNVVTLSGKKLKRVANPVMLDSDLKYTWFVGSDEVGAKIRYSFATKKKVRYLTQDYLFTEDGVTFEKYVFTSKWSKNSWKTPGVKAVANVTAKDLSKLKQGFVVNGKKLKFKTAS